MNPLKLIFVTQTVAMFRGALLALDASDLQEFIADQERRNATPVGPANLQAGEEYLAIARIALHASNQVREVMIPKEEREGVFRRATEELQRAQKS